MPIWRKKVYPNLVVLSSSLFLGTLLTAKSGTNTMSKISSTQMWKKSSGYLLHYNYCTIYLKFDTTHFYTTIFGIFISWQNFTKPEHKLESLEQRPNQTDLIGFRYEAEISINISESLFPKNISDKFSFFTNNIDF